MPVHNESKWIDAAVASILNQTFEDLELVILDDGSTDGTASILNEWTGTDPRVRVETNKTSSGLAYSSNQAVQLCTASFIARMDGDDISQNDRIERQVAELRYDPRTVLVGTLCVGIDAEGRQIKSRDRGRLMHPGPFSPFPHGSIMFRRDAFDDVGGYRIEAEGCEDLDLFLRMSRAGKVKVVTDALYRYRYHAQNTALTVPMADRIQILKERERSIGYLSGHHPSGSDSRLAAETYMTMSAMSVWAGHRPFQKVGVKRDVLHGSIGQVARSVLYNTWGNVHPRSLRAALALGIRLRDRLATRTLRMTEVHEWRFGS